MSKVKAHVILDDNGELVFVDWTPQDDPDWTFKDTVDFYRGEETFDSDDYEFEVHKATIIIDDKEEWVK